MTQLDGTELRSSSVIDADISSLWLMAQSTSGGFDRAVGNSRFVCLLYLTPFPITLRLQQLEHNGTPIAYFKRRLYTESTLHVTSDAVKILDDIVVSVLLLWAAKTVEPSYAVGVGAFWEADGGGDGGGGDDGGGE